MRRLSVLAVSLLFIATTAVADVRGAWTAEVRDDGSMQMNLSYGNSHHGETMALSDFSGISAGAARASTQTPIDFELRREAGTVTFEGTFKNGFGGGQFTFTPSSSYGATLRSLGVPSDDRDRDEERQLLTMTLLDVSTDFIRSMQAEGYRVSARKYVAFRIFRVSADLVRDLRGLGYREIPADQLVAMRIHRVTPEFIREMKDAGYEHVPIEKLIAMRIHGIDANFVRKMNGAK